MTEIREEPVYVRLLISCDPQLKRITCPLFSGHINGLLVGRKVSRHTDNDEEILAFELYCTSCEFLFGIDDIGHEVVTLGYPIKS